MDAETRLERGVEVGLIGRDSGRRERGTFFARVIKARRSGDGKCYLTTIDEVDQVSTIMYDLNLDNYWITSVTHRLCTGWSAIKEPYVETLEDLNEAFETIQVCLDDESWDEPDWIPMESDDGDGEESVVPIGPKRIEVVFRKKLPGSDEEIKAVISIVLGARGKFSSATAAGKTWSKDKKTLSDKVSHFHESAYWISLIVLYGGGTTGSISTNNYARSNGEQPWHFLESTYAKFKPAETAVIRNWTPRPAPAGPIHTGGTGWGEEDDEIYGPYAHIAGGHYPNQVPHHTNRVPHHYQPPVGYFRVSGDEIGAELYRKQEDVREREPQTLEELVVIEKAIREKLKVEEAENQTSPEEEESKKKQNRTAHQRPTGNTGTNSTGSGCATKSVVGRRIEASRQISAHATQVDAQHCDCGGPECKNCEWTEMIGIRGSVRHPRTIH